ncbi:uncharacterized protein LOC131254326 [Magnolia sinica]|uniref:uncharacterized protein LOC131254326 n=1 Tax=Magnolia sinica TaxID=86752 RepID=UPI00265AC693|nr:uncharacterized protein LOC131254326 [Magnolia sinica]
MRDHFLTLTGITPSIIFWEIWLARNTDRMDGVAVSALKVISKVTRWIHVLAPLLSLQPSVRRTSAKALDSLGLLGNVIIPRHVAMIKWTRPPPGWIKVNVDGSALGNPGSSRGGGVGRSGDRNFLFAFFSGYGFGSNGRVETKAIWARLSLCRDLGFNKVELVSDSKVVVDSLNRQGAISWALWYWWARIKALMTSMEVSISYSP